MPWQLLVADVGGELDPHTGLPAFREVIVTVPRQSGKTTLILGWELQRCLGWGAPQRVVYSAQTGSDARKKLIDDQLPILEPRRRRLGITRILKGMGNEAVDFTNGSRITLLAGTEDSGHGKTVDLAVEDELFADTDHRRDQTLIPAMATRAAAQLLKASTMGTDESVALNAAIERGRAAVAAGLRSDVAYFEWSALVEDDPDDPATWWGCMPALGHTIGVPVIRHARANMSDSEFRRAFLNLRTKADARVIPAVVWQRACDPEASPESPLTFGLDVNPERSAAAIVAGGGGAAELVDHRAGTSWLVDRAVDLNGRHGGRWVLDAAGPAGPFAEKLAAEGLEVHKTGAREMIDACAVLFDALMDGTVRVRPDRRLDDAVAVAARRNVGDAWAWARKSSVADISPLVALTLAVGVPQQVTSSDPMVMYR